MGHTLPCPESKDALWDMPIREPEERPQNSLSLGPQPGSPGTAGQGRAREEPPGQEVFMVAQPCEHFHVHIRLSAAVQATEKETSTAPMINPKSLLTLLCLQQPRARKSTVL